MTARHRGLAVLTAALLGACATTSLERAVPSSSPVARWTTLELDVAIAHPDRDADDVDVRARFFAPSGRVLEVPGFAHASAFAVRVSPDELGRWRYRIEADAGGGVKPVSEGVFDVTNGLSHGPIRIDPAHPHALVHADATPFVVLGENRINVFDPSWNYARMSIEDYVAYMARNGMTTLRVFTFADCVDRPSTAVRLGCIEPKVGRFDDAQGDLFDRIFRAAEKNGIYVVLVANAIGFTPGADEVWKSWNDNPFNAQNGGPAKSVDDFFTGAPAREAEERRLDYVLARWGTSANLLAIDLLNEPEWDGAVPERVWVPWAEAMARHWKANDPFHHLVTAGPVGLSWNVGQGSEVPWYASSADDVVQWHLYGKEFYESHALAKEMTRRTAETWPFDKPVFCGEFAYGGEAKPLYDHTHVGLWSAIFSGAGVLAHSAPPFNVDSDELMTPERAHHFRVLADFLARLHERGAFLPIHDVTATGADAWALAHGDDRALWLLGPEDGYDEPRRAEVTLDRLRDGRYRARFWNDVTGEELGSLAIVVAHGRATFTTPEFVRHLALVVVRDGR